VLAATAINPATSFTPILAAMLLFALMIALTLTLRPSPEQRMPLWLAIGTVAGATAMSVAVLVVSRLSPDPGANGAGWHVAAAGILMAVLAARRRQFLAWLGIAGLAVQTVLTGGLDALVAQGVVGSIAWVAISHALTTWSTAVVRNAESLAIADREAVQWRAAQDAHTFERRVRLEHTSRMALPMLHTIANGFGRLNEDQRSECRYLEAAIRDEIRGRALLNDGVRDAVMTARRRGTEVMLLDEGGIDSLSEGGRQRVLHDLAAAIGGTVSDRIVARTVAEDRSMAVTVLALTAEVECDENGDQRERIDLWLEIPREQRRT